MTDDATTIILGVDPGLRRTGFGLVEVRERRGHRFRDPADGRHAHAARPPVVTRALVYSHVHHDRTT